MEQFELTPRQLYVEKIFEAIKQNDLCFVCGIRRGGKTSIATLFEHQLIQRINSPFRVARYNYESMDSAHCTKDEMIAIFNKNYDKSKTNYLILDEINRVVDWESVINHILLFKNCKVIIISSNRLAISKRLDCVKTKSFSVVDVYPLSLPEFMLFQGYERVDSFSKSLSEARFSRHGEGQYSIKDIYDSYITFGSLPILKPEYMDHERAWVMTDGSYGTIILRDILEFGNCGNMPAVTDTVLLRSIITILCKSICSNTSPTRIGKQCANYISHTSSTKTTENYINALINANLFYVSERYDIKSGQTLKTLPKFYIVDAGLHNYLAGIDPDESGAMLENQIYFELLRRGYSVKNGKLGREEIHMLATVNNETIYIQIAKDHHYSSIEKAASLLRKIRDYHPKIIIAANDKTSTLPDGIQIVNAMEFLLGFEL